jgi:DNA-binding MarR family transcriptional regulator
MTDGRELARRVQAAYPKIYLACHVRHARGSDGVGVSNRDANLLGHVDRERPSSPTALARHLGVTPATLSEQLASLGERGLLAMKRRAEDKRRIDVVLTVKGANAMQAASVLDTARLTALLERLPATERAIAVHGMELLAEAARELMAEHSGKRAWVDRRRVRRPRRRRA